MPEAVPLIGRPFILGSHDCWGLIMDWHATQGVTLDDFRVDYPWWESQYPDNFYFDNWEQEGFIECDPRPGAWSSCRLNPISGTMRALSLKRVNCSITYMASPPALPPMPAAISRTGR